MVIKGQASKGATAHFVHLSNAVDNEQVHIYSIRGSVSKGLHGALREWEVIGSQSNATKLFYAVSISPDPRQREWDEADYLKAINRVEVALGLDNQPRAIVFHEKVGEADGEARKHCHVIFSRVDGQTLKAIPNRGDYYILKRTAQSLAQEMKLELPNGLNKKQSYDLAKSQGVNRDVETTQERKATITKIWEEQQSKRAFEIALSNAGFVLAQGDRRSHVVIDRDGQVHSLARQISGARIKQVRERLGDSESYPSVEQAKDEQRIRLAEATPKQEKKQKPLKDMTLHSKLMAKLMRQGRRADHLRTERRKKLKAMKHSAMISHQQEWEWHHRRFQEKTADLIKKRIKKQPRGLFKGLRQTFLAWKYAHEDRKRLMEHDTKRQHLEQAQAQELQRIERQKELIRKQEQKEAYTIEKLSKRLAIQKQSLKKTVGQEQRRQKQQNSQQVQLLIH